MVDGRGSANQPEIQSMHRWLASGVTKGLSRLFTLGKGDGFRVSFSSAVANTLQRSNGFR